MSDIDADFGVSNRLYDLARQADIKQGEEFTIIDGQAVKVDSVHNSIVPRDRYIMSWRLGDIDLEDTVTFTPERLEFSLQPKPTTDGKEWIRLDINGLYCTVIIGQENTIPRYFWNAYHDAEENYHTLQDLMEHGPIEDDYDDKGKKIGTYRRWDRISTSGWQRVSPAQFGIDEPEIEGEYEDLIKEKNNGE